MGVPPNQPANAQGGADAAYETHTDVLAALTALVDCQSQLENEPLQSAVTRGVGQLVGTIEGSCRQLVEFLLQGVPSESSEVAYDRLWTLRSMGKMSEATRRWILDAGGMAAVVSVMAAHPTHEKLQKEGTWLVYVLGGIEGLLELLRTNRGKPPVQEAAAWAVFDLGLAQRDRGQAGTAEWPEGDALTLLLLEALQQNSSALHPQAQAQGSPGEPKPKLQLDLLWACCSALRVLISGHAFRGTLFVERGGDEAVLKALGTGQAAGAAGESVLVSGMQLIAALVEGNSQAAHRLRALGALDGLVACGLSLPGKTTDETMWTLGQVGGVLAVLQVMSRASESRDAVHCGLAALSKLTWTPLEEVLQQQFPQALSELLELARRVAAVRPVQDVVYTLQALGGVLHVIAPQCTPGAWQVADDAVELLIKAVAPPNDVGIVQAAVASLGHVAARAPAWRARLQPCLADIGNRMRMPGEREENMKYQKCLFWTSAVIAGMPVILQEMRNQPNAPNVQDAAISAIVDILDDHMDGPASGEESGIHAQHVPSAIETIAGAMRLHRTHVPVQSGGCYALGLLHGALPGAEGAAKQAVDSVLGALRWHPTEYKVVIGVCSALRAFLEARSGVPESGNAVARTAAELRGRELVPSLRKLLEDFVASTDKTLLEDAVYALAVLDGLPAALQVLARTEAKQVHLRSAGLKAIFELGRLFPDLLASPQRQQEIKAVAVAIHQDVSAKCSVCPGRPAGSASADQVELLRQAELLQGLLQQVT